ncbi:MAG TPA: thioredoxin domain-containing protein [Anaerolineales bacterium]|nr:thioredoxin domain-containing protein [Anaerolineales bacterium]
MSQEKTSKRQERRAKMQRQRQQQRWIIIGFIVLVVAFLAVIVYSQRKPPGDIFKVTPAALPNPNGLSLGDANAPVTIDVFEDFQCPACKSFTENIEPLVIENLVTPGKARYTFHQYSFIDGEGASNGGESDQAANASMCANEQGKFWEMHASLYANWNGENQGAFRDSRLQAMAESIGLDMNAFNTCFKDNKYKKEIQADYDLGKQMGVNGTPTVFVNGVQAGQPGKIATYDEIAQAVEQALNK